VRIVQLALVTAVAIGGCQKSTPVSAPPADAVSSPTTPVSVTEEPDGEPWPIKSTEFLEVVPADTPYVLAQTEPVPQEFVQRFRPMLDPLVDAMDEGIAKQMQDASPELRRIAEELFGGPPSVRDLDKLGIDLNPRFVVYGLGLAPVLRVRLRDATTFERAIDGLETVSKKPSSVAVFHGQRYRYSKSEDGTLTVFAIVGPDAVVAVLPPGEVQRELLPLAFGQTLPEKALAAENHLARVRADHRLGPYFNGYIDIVAVAASVTGQGHGLHGRVAESYPSLAKRRAPECVVDWLRLANAMPRAAFGYDLSAKRVVGSGTLELSPAVARHMAAIPGPIPGLGPKSEAGALALFGAGIDPRGLETALNAFATAVREQPFRCEDLASLNRLGEMIASAPAVAPQVFAITGIGAVLRDIDPNPEKPTVDALVVLGLRDPKGALTALAPLVPNLKVDKLGKRGVPVRAATLTSSPSEFLADAWVALGKQSIGMSLSSAGKRDLLRTLDRQRKDDRTLVMWMFDFALWARRHPELFKEMMGADANKQKYAEAALELTGPTTVEVRATDKGLELEGTFEILKPKR
jgi:hypothetical protein